VSAPSDDRIVDAEEELDPAARDRVEVLERGDREEEHADADFEEEVPAQAAGHFEQVMHVLGAVFRGEELDVEAITELSVDEKAAIEALRDVVRGRDSTEDQLLYAEERLGLLNQALSVLQPTLAMALTPELAALRDEYDAVVEEVVGLREHLESLDSAQEEIFEQDRERFVEVPDTDDKPDDDAKPDEAAAPETAAQKEEKEKKGLLDFFRRKKDKPAEAKPTAEPGDPDAPRTSSLYGAPGEPAVEKKPGKSTLGDD
jgi:hypothetical protein